MSDVPSFPLEDSLCEACGYPLRGLPYEKDCPECGLKIEESDPAKRRPGLPWQNEISFRSWVATVVALVSSPRRAFDELRVHSRVSEQRVRDDCFLGTISFIVGFMWVALGGVLTGDWSGGRPFLLYVAVSTGLVVMTVVMTVVIALTYIEALGVAWFSRRRGWRVPFRLAERVSCYASIGWVPAGILCNILWLWYDRRLFRGGWYPFFGDERDLLILMSVAMITILWFESLVWVGVRRVKFANAR